MKRRLLSKKTANNNNNGSPKNRFPRGKKSCVLAACVLVAVLLSVRQTLSNPSALEQWPSLSLSLSTVAVAESGTGSTNVNTNGERTVYFRTDSDNHQSVHESKDKTESANDVSTELIVPNRTVRFMKRPEFLALDPYSGMWWQNVEHFHKLDASRLGQQTMRLEAASWEVFGSYGGRRTRMTRDWFDFAVEHLSMYHRHFEVNSEKTGIPFKRITLQLLEYIKKTKAYPWQKDAAPASTIVVCPFNVQQVLKAGPSYQKGEKENQLRIHSLAATLASLWQAGMARAVVVGALPVDGEAAQVAFDLVRRKTKSSMELSFVICSNITTGLDDNTLMPPQAIAGLQMALSGKLDASQTQEWVGDTPKRWKYVYFTEPDLVLSSRPGSIHALTFALDKGCVMAGHRLQPIPHALDFPGFKDLRKIVPAVGNFSAASIRNVDTAEYVCCDAGNGRPGDIPQPECESFWWQCGFNLLNENYSDLEGVLDAHRRKVPYTWLRLGTGTGAVMMATTEHARACTLLRRGSCEKRKALAEN
jgi:hypothetical protein